MHVSDHILDDNQMIDQEKIDLVARMGETGTAERIKIPCLKLKNPLPQRNRV